MTTRSPVTMADLTSGGAVTGIYPNADAWVVIAIIAAVALLYACLRVSK